MGNIITLSVKNSIPSVDTIPVSKRVLEFQELISNVVLPDWVNVLGLLVIVVLALWVDRVGVHDGVGSGLTSLGILSDHGEEVSNLEFIVAMWLYLELLTIVKSGPFKSLSIGSEVDWFKGEVIGSLVVLHDLVVELEHTLREEVESVHF